MKPINQRRSSLPATASSIKCNEFAEFLKKKKRWGGRVLGPFVRYLNNCLVGFLFTILLRVRNRFKAHRRDVLLKAVYKRPKKKGLLSVSNHQSMLDDPGLWAAVLPWLWLRPETLRWSLCTDDVFFAKPWLTSILSGGNVIPLDRAGSLEQPMFRAFQQKLAAGAWCHIFAEGRIWQNWRFEDKDEPVLGPFKYGVGKLIAHSYPNSPLVLPIYHRGMSGVLPERVLEGEFKKRPSTPQSPFPKGGQQIDMNIGKPIDFSKKLERFERTYPGQLGKWTSTFETIYLYKDITDEIRSQVLELEAEAYGRKE